MKMNICLLFVFCGTTICAMDDEEKPNPEHQLQLIINNKNTTTEQFSTYISSRPKLYEITVTGHQISSIPQLGIMLTGLHTLDLSNGSLEHSNTVPCILTLAPNLSSCKLAQNKIPALSEKCDNDDLPMHYALTELNCNGNKITKVNFTELWRKLPNLTQLDVSNCPISEFNTKNLRALRVTTTIDLRKTCLPDSQKKEILKNAQHTCLIDISDKCENIALAISSTVIGGVSVISFFIPIITMPFSVGAGTVVAATLANIFGSSAIGFGISYLGFLGFKSPSERFKKIYIPLMDNTDYSEQEITTRYSRFVRYFPYFCNIIKCCRAEDPEYFPLNQVEGNQ